MALKPMRDTIFGELIQHQSNEEILGEFKLLTEAFEDQHRENARLQAAAVLSGRQIEAATAARRNAHYQVLVTEIGPECIELEEGDIAILPPFGGTMVTVVDEETSEFRRVFAIRERDVLARFRAEE